MTYTPTRETLELAAHACGKMLHFTEEGFCYAHPIDCAVGHESTEEWQPSIRQLKDAALAGSVDLNEAGMLWEPQMHTAEGKADLLDLMLAAGIEYVAGYNCLTASNEHQSLKTVQIVDGNKHAALARAVIEVAAQVGAKIKGTPC